jgi:predicted transcriptional regulator
MKNHDSSMSMDEYKAKWNIPLDWPLTNIKLLKEKRDNLLTTRHPKAEKAGPEAEDAKAENAAAPAPSGAVAAAIESTPNGDKAMAYLSTKYKSGVVPETVIFELPILFGKQVDVPEELEFQNEQESIGVRSLRAQKDKILCLECSRWVNILSKAHTIKLHGLDTMQYREKWNIPRQWHLTSMNLIDTRKDAWARKPEPASPPPATEEAPKAEAKAPAETKAPAEAKAPGKASRSSPAAATVAKEQSVQANAISQFIETLTYAPHVNIPEEFKGYPEDQLTGIKSLFFNDAQILCLECGIWVDEITHEHMRVKHEGMTFEEYKKKWKIPLKYPLVCQELLRKKPEAEESVETRVRRGKGKGHAKAAAQ